MPGITRDVCILTKCRIIDISVVRLINFFRKHSLNPEPAKSSRRVSAAEFKKDISKVFGSEMRRMGFKGSGFNFRRESDDFLFVIGIQGSNWGPSCCVEFGVQPKAIRTNGFSDIDFKKLKYYQCELRTRLSPMPPGDHWWSYSADPIDNVNTALRIAGVIEEQALPTVRFLEENAGVLKTIDVADLVEPAGHLTKKLNIPGLGTTKLRLAWVLALINENENLNKAKEFAEFGLAGSLETPTFFAIPDFKRILAK